MDKKAQAEIAAQRSLNQKYVKLILMDEVPALNDFDMELGDLQKHIEGLIKIHGPRAHLRTDGGHNNVQFELYYEVSAADLKDFMKDKK